MATRLVLYSTQVVGFQRKHFFCNKFRPGTESGYGRGMSYKRFLLVDDDAPIRGGLGHALRDENFQVVPAATGREALAKVNEPPIDIALLALNLGRHCGWDPFRKLNELHPRLPI